MRVSAWLCVPQQQQRLLHSPSSKPQFIALSCPCALCAVCCRLRCGGAVHGGRAADEQLRSATSSSTATATPTRILHPLLLPLSLTCSRVSLSAALRCCCAVWSLLSAHVGPVSVAGSTFPSPLATASLPFFIPRDRLALRLPCAGDLGWSHARATMLHFAPAVGEFILDLPAHEDSELGRKAEDELLSSLEAGLQALRQEVSDAALALHAQEHAAHTHTQMHHIRATPPAAERGSVALCCAVAACC